MHFSEPARIRRAAPVCACILQPMPRRTNDGLEAAGVLASPAAPRTFQDESGHVTSRLREWKRRDWGTGRVRLSLVVHRDARCLRRQRAALTVTLVTTSLSSSAAPIYDQMVQLLRADRLGAAWRIRRCAAATTDDSVVVGLVLVIVERQRRTWRPAPRIRRRHSRGHPTLLLDGSPSPRSKAPGPDCLSFLASSKRR